MTEPRRSRYPTAAAPASPALPVLPSPAGAVCARGPASSPPAPASEALRVVPVLILWLLWAPSDSCRHLPPSLASPLSPAARLPQCGAPGSPACSSHGAPSRWAPWCRAVHAGPPGSIPTPDAVPAGLPDTSPRSSRAFRPQGAVVLPLLPPAPRGRALLPPNDQARGLGTTVPFTLTLPHAGHSAVAVSAFQTFLSLGISPCPPDTASLGRLQLVLVSPLSRPCTRVTRGMVTRSRLVALFCPAPGGLLSALGTSCYSTSGVSYHRPLVSPTPRRL